MMELNVQQVSKSFGLNDTQSFLFDMLYKEGGEMELTRCRDKCRLKGITSFEYALKTLAKKDVILIGYKDDEKRYAAISPEIPILLREKEAVYQAKEGDEGNKSPKPRQGRTLLNRRMRENLKTDFIAWLKEKAGEIYTKDDLLNAITHLPSSPNFTFPRATFNVIVRELVSEKYLTKVTQNGNRLKYLINANPFIQEDNMRLGLAENDITALEEIFKTFGISDNPTRYLLCLAEKIALRFLDQKITYTGITFSSDMWKKFQTVDKDLQVKENVSLPATIQRLVTNYIEREYEKRRVLLDVKEMIASSTDPLVLAELQNFLNSRISEITKTVT
jgi:hypothetical protein